MNHPLTNQAIKKSLLYKTVLLYGSLSFMGDVKKKQALSRSLGIAIVSHPFFQLLTGGNLGDEANGGGVDYHSAMGAGSFLANKDLEQEKIVTLLPTNSDKGFFRLGRIKMDSSSDVNQRRKNLVAMADFVITVEGGPGTLEILKYALSLQTPILPIRDTGGVSEAIWEDNILRNQLVPLLEKSSIFNKYFCEYFR